jgi:hypothetical protein
MLRYESQSTAFACWLELISAGNTDTDVKVQIWEIKRLALSPSHLPRPDSEVHTSEYLPMTKTQDVPPSSSTHVTTYRSRPSARMENARTQPNQFHTHAHNFHTHSFTCCEI